MKSSHVFRNLLYTLSQIISPGTLFQSNLNKDFCFWFWFCFWFCCCCCTLNTLDALESLEALEALELAVDFVPSWSAKVVREIPAPLSVSWSFHCLTLVSYPLIGGGGGVRRRWVRSRRSWEVGWGGGGYRRKISNNILPFLSLSFATFRYVLKMKMRCYIIRTYTII